MIVGLTGGIGSGKSTVAKEFQKIANIAVYFADVEAKKLMTNSLTIKKKLIEEFGENAFVNNQLNRAFIADVVFTNKDKLNTLNAIVHPEVIKHFESFFSTNKDKEYVLYENAILFENKSALFCDVIITVVATESLRIQRVVKRDSVSEADVKNRIQNQWSDAKKALLSNYIITNNELNDISIQVARIHNILTK
jgi:dephospho-CoA kinase